MTPRTLLVAALLSLSGCATLPLPTLQPVLADDAKLRMAADAFYSATRVQDLREALAAARSVSTAAALTHELEASLSLLAGDEAGRVAHLLAALRDANDPDALFHLHALMGSDFTFDQRALVKRHLEALTQHHAQEPVRALAAYHWLGLMTADGELDARADVRAALTGLLPFDVVGTWDNDQGKGFDLELGPEARPGLTERYEGRSGTLGWRLQAPLDPRGRLDLSSLMSPTRWSVAFAHAAVQVTQAGRYELRLSSTDPLKVWVDGQQVFAAAQLDKVAFDHLVLPLQLTAGSHTVLVKSAHREGSWWLLGRLVPAAADAPAVADVAAALKAATRHVEPSSPRGLWLASQWALQAAGGNVAVKAAEAFARAHKSSLFARVGLVEALWHNQERGRVADLLAALDGELGGQVPFVRLRQLRFLLQQGLRLKAREGLLPLVKQPDAPKEALELLVDLYRSESWLQDELAAHRLLEQRFGSSPEQKSEYARALLRDGRRAEALAQYREVLDEQPYAAEPLRSLANLHQDDGALDDAARLFEARLEAWPLDQQAWLSLAETRRRQGQGDAALAALEKAEALCPECPSPHSRRGELLYERNDTARALAAWKRALQLNPENDTLANRIDFLSPEARGPWMADVPDEAALAKSVAQRTRTQQKPGADVAYLLDHEVTLLNSDGSTSNVVTLVLHAFNAQGRDRIMRQSVGSGRLRVMHAYSVDERGARSEASSERSRSIYFRGMQPNSTLVLQYRLDTPPSGFLARFLTKTWSFQGVSDQRTESTFVLWTPSPLPLHEERIGPVQRSQTKVGEQMRVVWTLTDAAPLPAEQGMPTIGELTANIKLSTVPDWKTWLSWEQALLEGAFRDSPEIDALAQKLGDGATDAQERLLRVHQFVMEEIRYQQDYESFIAGVKPHPAPMVLERRYGDCKDKAVLFITLAKKLGLDAHFALVRTRNAGPVIDAVPMQQFNHAIVYVPEQPGVAARFFDPTAELLDLDVVRSDDVGTRSLVFDPKEGTHTWREIPYQGPEANRERIALSLAVDAQGAAQGTMRMEAKGRTGSTLRRIAHNDELFKQMGQRLAAMVVPNATATDVEAVDIKSLRAPAVVQQKVSSSTFAKREGDTLRVRLPTEWSPRTQFSLATRRHPLLLGTPTLYENRLELTLPDGFEVKKLPASGELALPCLSLSRTVKVEGGKLVADSSYRFSCERLSASEYPAYREKADDMSRLLEDELVLGPAAPAKGGKKPVVAPKK